MPQFQTAPRTSVPSRLAVRFILVSACVYVAALGLGLLLIWFLPPTPVPGRVVFPPVFWMTSLLLAVGSALLQHGAWSVQHERQKPFRRSLLLALIAGTLFVGLQIYGLRSLAENQLADETQTGANAFVTIFAALHAMHFSLALLFLVWVALNAFADRYDHEYSWGVTVCAWFWHALGIVWLCILVVFMIACLPGADRI
jgi:heme/copper-type cytochrome/quinol oxidase subunit 3